MRIPECAILQSLSFLICKMGMARARLMVVRASQLHCAIHFELRAETWKCTVQNGTDKEKENIFYLLFQYFVLCEWRVLGIEPGAAYIPSSFSFF